MAKKIRLSILKEQREPSQGELEKYCPELEQLIKSAEESELASDLAYYKSLAPHCRRMKKIDTAKATGNRKDLEKFLQQQKLSNMSSTVDEYYRKFVNAIANFNFNTESVVTGQDPDNVATKEENECFWDVGTHATRAATITVSYLAFINIANYLNDGNFARQYINQSRTPLRFFGNLLKKSWPFASGTDASALELDKQAAKVLGGGDGKNLSIDDRLRSLDDVGNEAAKKGWFRWADRLIRGTGRWGLWLGVLAGGGATTYHALRSEEGYGTTNETLSTILTWTAIQDVGPKLLAADTLYGEQASTDLAKGQFTEDPCNFLGPFFAMAAIAVLRSRKFQQLGSRAGQIGKYGFGQAGTVIKQVDYQNYFQTVATRLARQLDQQIENFASFLKSKQDQFDKIFKSTSKNNNLYDNIPDDVQDVYMNWARNRLQVNKGLADDLSDQKLLDDIEATWGKKIDELNEDELVELKYFIGSYNRGISTVTSEAGVVFNRTNLSTYNDAVEKIHKVGRSAKNRLINLVQGGGDGIGAGQRAGTEVRPGEVKPASGQTPDELQETLEMQAQRADRRTAAEIEKSLDDMSDLGAREKEAAELLAKDPKSGISAAEKSGAIDRTAARRAAGLNPDDDAAKVLEVLGEGNPTAILRESDEAYEALRMQLSELFSNPRLKTRGGDTLAQGVVRAEPEEALLEVLTQINRNADLRKALVKRIFTKYFPDEAIDDILLRTDKIPNSVDEATVIYNSLIKKFGTLPEGARLDAIKKELVDILDQIKKDVGEYKGGAKRQALGDGVTAVRQAAFEDGAWPFMLSATTLLVGSGIIYGWYATEKVTFSGGDDGFYYVGEGPIARRSAALFNAWGGRLSLKGVAENEEILNKRLQKDDNLNERQARTKLNVAAIQDIITLPRGMNIQDLIDNKKAPIKFQGRIKFWRDLIRKPAKFDDMKPDEVYNIFLNGVNEDMKYAVGQEAGDPNSPIQNISSKDLDLPEIRNALQFRYGRPGRLIKEIADYLKGAKKRSESERLREVNEMFSYEKARVYAKGKALKKAKEVTKEISDTTRRKIKENQRYVEYLDAKGKELSKFSEASINMRFAIRNLEEYLKGAFRLELSGNELTAEQREQMENYIERINNNNLLTPQQKTDLTFPVQLKLGTPKNIKKEHKIMDKELLENLVRSMLTENRGQGYNHYPYYSKSGLEDEPAEDFIEDWKAFELALVRDQSRETAICLAKILVKDLELFGDVVDLIGKNQSVGTEILKKFAESKDKTKS